MQRALFGLAQSCHEAQQQTHDGTLKYVQALHMAGECTPILYVQHLKYDETPLRKNVEFPGDDASVQVAKVIVVEQQWAVLLRLSSAELPKFLRLSGSFSTAVRAAESATAESLEAVLATCPSPDPDLVKNFQHRYRLVETDRCPANLRCERLIAQTQAWPSARSHSFCGAHGCHLIALKTWALDMEILSGCIQTLLVLQTPGAFHKLQEQMVKDFEDKFIVIRDFSLSTEAEQFRDKILTLFAPRAHRRKSSALIRTLSAMVYNGDWRKDTVSHICRGCCSSPEESKTIALKHIPKLLRALKFKMMSKSDSAMWSDSLAMLGFMSGMHKVFGPSFVKAFSAVAETPPPPPLGKPRMQELQQ